QPLCIVVLRRRTDCLDGDIGGISEADEAADQLGDASEDKQKSDSSSDGVSDLLTLQLGVCLNSSDDGVNLRSMRGIEESNEVLLNRLGSIDEAGSRGRSSCSHLFLLRALAHGLGRLG
ncbi:hypothetical protein PMAYCL1PPCAC_23424, partial [Pristionchus mayeri]